MENLDLRCAELGNKLAQPQGVDVTLLTKALAVLDEQGLYAFFLFLAADGKEPAKAVSTSCTEFLKKTPADNPLLGHGELWQELGRLAGALDSLLFARDLLRQALVYGRYHAKVHGSSKS